MEQGLAECVVMVRPICIAGEPDRITFLHHPALLQLFAVGERCGNVPIAVSGISLLRLARARARLSLVRARARARALSFFVCLSGARARTCLLSLSDKHIHT
jgi:hypothetical protein